jgi:putative peptidoglycan lipid II flippase
VSWISYADRLMEFPIALLGVALGVVLMPQLACAQASGDADAYSSMLDWGLRLVVVLAWPCAVALLVFAQPLVAVLYHYGAFTDRDVAQTTLALMGYGVGVLGLVAIKVLAPGFFAKQDTRTPVRIAVAVLIFTQVMNFVLVPYLAHAALTLSIGLAAAQPTRADVDYKDMAEHLLAEADAALYRAKSAGRNRLAVAGDTDPDFSR